jgi:hypothetical protein
LALHDLAPQPGSLISLPDVLFTCQAYGPLHAIAWWDKQYDEPLYLITTLELAEEACHWYRRRYRIETLFSDKKSRGFHVDKSHLSNPMRLARLLIATSLAYIWMVYLGISVVQNNQTDLIDRTDRTDKSLFRLGLDWLTHLLKHDKPILVEFSVPPYSQCPQLEHVR